MKSFRILIFVLLSMMFAENANAQFGGLGKSLKNAAKNKVESAVKSNTESAKNNAESAVKETAGNAQADTQNKVTSAAEYKTLKNAPQVGPNSSARELYTAAIYWSDVQEAAAQAKDVEWLTSSNGEKLKELTEMIRKKDNGGSLYNGAKSMLDKTMEVTTAALLDGQPKDDGTNESLVARMKWFVEKIKNGSENEKRFYTVKAGAERYLAFTSKKYKDTPEMQQATNELKKYWDSVDEENKTKYPQYNPNLTYEKVMEYGAKEEAETAAAKQKGLEASKVQMKPGALDKTMNAQVLKVAKQDDSDIFKVVVTSDSWSVKRDNFGNITRRVVYAWVVWKDADGNLKGKENAFAEEYLGGGKYDSLRLFGTGFIKYVK